MFTPPNGLSIAVFPDPDGCEVFIGYFSYDMDTEIFNSSQVYRILPTGQRYFTSYGPLSENKLESIPYMWFHQTRPLYITGAPEVWLKAFPELARK